MQHILSLVRRCVEDYDMIDAGETVAAGSTQRSLTLWR